MNSSPSRLDRRAVLRWLLAGFGAAALGGWPRYGHAASDPPGLRSGEEAEPVLPARFVSVRGSRMAYRETGAGRPIVFLHGNPTSSLLWRGVMPRLAAFGRCIAPDLIGMGESDKLSPSGPARYSFAEHSRYLAAFLRAVGVNREAVLVVHDWGSTLGFDWARRHAAAVRALAFMECFVVSANSRNTPAPVLEWFSRFRTAEGGRAVLEDNEFLERIFLGQFPDMPDSIRAAYRKPFATPGEDRRPTLTFPQQVPINGDPPNVHRDLVRGLEWVAQSPIPKLFVNAEPGALIVGSRKDICRSWRNVREARIAARHFVPEDAPDALAGVLAEWLGSLG